MLMAVLVCFVPRADFVNVIKRLRLNVALVLGDNM